jgi:uncharacterized protein YbgA (DUF1722 family)
MSWEKRRLETYQDLLQDLDKMTATKRRKDLFKFVRDEFKEIDQILKNKADWKAPRKELVHLIAEFEDDINDVNDKRQFEKCVKDYVLDSNGYMNERIMCDKYLTSESGSFHSESESDESVSDESGSGSESGSESESE